MIRVITMLLMVVLLCSGCDLNAREEALQKKEAQLAEREQQLSLKEKLLAIREEEILQIKQKLDSAKTKLDSAMVTNDTLVVFNQELIGRWNVKMTCTETTCSGSAVGDTKTEMWHINYENNVIVAKAMVNEKLVRVYSGSSYDGNTLTLIENVTQSPNEPVTKITIRLTLTGDETMEGQREIVRESDCRIVYNLQLNKQKSSSQQ